MTVFNVTEFEEKIIELRKKGWAKHDIAAEFKVSILRVSTILKKHNINVKIKVGRK